ncbi:MAG: hypothetical protein ACTHJ0_12040 [Flavipsychrobacter sp.]
MHTCIEKQMLQHYRHLAEVILQRHISIFNNAVRHKTQQRSGINAYLQSINTELKVNADRLLNEVKANSQVDCKKLQEHLFVLRKDYFNDFLKKSELNYTLY